MKTFNQFIEAMTGLSGDQLGGATPSSSMRVGRPAPMAFDKLEALVQELQNPSKKQAIINVLKKHPETQDILARLVQVAGGQGLINTQNFNNIKDFENHI